MKYLGIDYGKKRIGLAISEAGKYASPIKTIANKGDQNNVAAVREVMTKHDILPTMSRIVCGIPLDIDGNDTPMSLEIKKFGERLCSELGVQVIYKNERYSSVEAEQFIREKMGITKFEKMKELVDGVAASMILQSYLDTHVR